MCPESSKAKVSVGNAGKEEFDGKTSNLQDHNLANFVNTTNVYLQTLRVKLVNEAKECSPHAYR